MDDSHHMHVHKIDSSCIGQVEFEAKPDEILYFGREDGINCYYPMLYMEDDGFYIRSLSALEVIASSNDNYKLDENPDFRGGQILAYRGGPVRMRIRYSSVSCIELDYS